MLSEILLAHNTPVAATYFDARLAGKASEFALRGVLNGSNGWPSKLKIEAQGAITLVKNDAVLAGIGVDLHDDELRCTDPSPHPSSHSYHLLQSIHWCRLLVDASINVATAAEASRVTVPSYQAIDFDVRGLKPNLVRSFMRGLDPAFYEASPLVKRAYHTDKKVCFDL
jgi:hypothetical protein